jgi:hypothetical protein
MCLNIRYKLAIDQRRCQFRTGAGRAWGLCWPQIQIVTTLFEWNHIKFTQQSANVFKCGPVGGVGLPAHAHNLRIEFAGTIEWRFRPIAACQMCQYCHCVDIDNEYALKACFELSVCCTQNGNWALGGTFLSQYKIVCSARGKWPTRLISASLCLPGSTSLNWTHKLLKQEGPTESYISLTE